MEMTVIGTGSKGNCYLLHNASEGLIIEAGMPYESIVAAAGAKMMAKVKGCIVTHEHQDHAKYAKQLLDHAIPVWATPGTTQAIIDRGRSRVMQPQPFPFFPGQTSMFTIGGFSIIPFEVVHDAIEPCGFFIHHAEMGNLLFATDTARICPTFQSADHIFIECNYHPAKLAQRTDIPVTLKHRIERSHMSIYQCIRDIQEQDFDRWKVSNLVLIHISDSDGDPELFTELVKQATGIEAKAARPGLTLRVNVYPF